MDAVQLSTVAKNWAEAAAVLLASGGFVAWIAQRRDRSADMLLKLDELFGKSDVVEGRQFLESHDRQTPFTKAEQLKLDPLLRFYLVLLGVMKAKQVDRAILQSCYRYWLGCGHPKNTTRYNQPFRDYVMNYWPTLDKWLDEEQRRDKGFFDNL